MADDAAPQGPTYTSVYVGRNAGDEMSAIKKFAGVNDGTTIESSSIEYEDEFRGKYGSQLLPGVAGGVQIIEPTIAPKVLMGLMQHNNTLQQCADALVTNVHGTGYDIDLANPDAAMAGSVADDNDPTVKAVSGFLNEVWPGMSFKQMRMKIGNDKESTGNWYVEVLRNRAGDLVMLRRLEPKLTRMVTMSPASPQPVTINRGGVDITIDVMMRYRRFVQSLGTRNIFYKEYGCPLLINKKTGELLPDNPQNRILLLRTQAMGTEIMQGRAVEDVDTPYGVPRWIAQMPSVIGSRKAEEHNLEYFEAGGVPPLMIFVQGGTLGAGMKVALQEFLSSKPGAKQGAPVFEVQATGGTLDSPGQGARVLVERFGTERQKDSMFEAYDDKCEGRIRRAWRMPPIFVGKATDYNLATAQASYAVAEAQVFKPERDEFDDLWNKTIIRELDPSGKVVMRSRGLPVKDVNQQLLAANAAFAGGGLDIDHYVAVLNEIVSLNMKVGAEAVANQKRTNDAKAELGEALVEVAKRPPPQQAGTAPGARRPPASKGKGSQSGPSSSSPKPKVLTKGEGAAEKLALALAGRDMVSLQEVTDALPAMGMADVLAFKHHLMTGEFLSILKADDNPEVLELDEPLAA